jgi:hypothetical protein
MAKDTVKPKTVQYAVHTPRAIAMGEVAKSPEFKSDVIVGSWPIIGRESALEAFADAIQIDEKAAEKGEEPEASEMTAEDVDNVRQRYLDLGERGTSSGVVVTVQPHAVESFDFPVFYDRVDETQAGYPEPVVA